MTFYTLDKIIEEREIRLKIAMDYFNDFDLSHYEENLSCSLERTYFTNNGKQVAVTNVSTGGLFAEETLKNEDGYIQFYYGDYCVEPL